MLGDLSVANNVEETLKFKGLVREPVHFSVLETKERSFFFLGRRIAIKYMKVALRLRISLSLSGQWGSKLYLSLKNASG